jgi:hypothetical protein
MDSVRWLVGTWNCHHTVGDFSGDYSTTYSRVLGGLWLRQTYEFPPDRDDPSGRQADSLIGFDPRRNYWIRFFAMSNGDWFATRMTETGKGWAWKYVSLSSDKVRKPETPDPDATFTQRSDSEYTIEGPSYEKAGGRVTEHHVCRKRN